MMSIPARSMSRIAVSAASSNISSRSAGPSSPRSCALTPANHQPGFPWEPTTAVGMRGSVMVSGLQHAWSRSAPDDTCEARVAPGVLRGAREHDPAALDDVQAARGLGHVVDVGLGDQDRMAELSDRRDRKSTRLNSSHSQISYAVFCLKKKKQTPLTRGERTRPAVRP